MYPMTDAIRETMRATLFDAMRACGEGCLTLPCKCADDLIVEHMRALVAASSPPPMTIHDAERLTKLRQFVDTDHGVTEPDLLFMFRVLDARDAAANAESARLRKAPLPSADDDWMRQVTDVFDRGKWRLGSQNDVDAVYTIVCAAYRAGREQMREAVLEEAFKIADEPLPEQHWDLRHVRRSDWACACGRIMERVRALSPDPKP